MPKSELPYQGQVNLLTWHSIWYIHRAVCIAAIVNWGRNKNALCGEVFFFFFFFFLLDALRASPETYKLRSPAVIIPGQYRLSVNKLSSPWRAHHTNALENHIKKIVATKWTITGNKHEWPNDQVLVIWIDQGKRTWTLERSRVVGYGWTSVLQIRSKNLPHALMTPYHGHALTQQRLSRW